MEALEFKLETIRLQEALKDLLLVAGLDSVIFKTNLIFIRVNPGIVTLKTISDSSSLYVDLPSETSASLEFALDLISLQKLVKTLTTESIKFIYKDQILTIRSNGQYKLNTIPNSLGEDIPFEDNRLPLENPNSLEVDFKSIYKNMKKSIGFMEPYSNFYFDKNGILVTDVTNASYYNKYVFDRILLSESTLESLSIFKNPNYNLDPPFLYVQEDNYYFKTIIQDIGDYQSKSLLQIFKQYINFMQIDLKPVLTRYALFGKEFVKLKFKPGELIILSDDETFKESISIENELDREYLIDFNALKKYTTTNSAIGINENPVIFLRDNDFLHVLSTKN